MKLSAGDRESPNFCSQCRLLKFALLRQGKPIEHGTLSSLKLSAKEGCPLCQIFVRGLLVNEDSSGRRFAGYYMENLSEETEDTEENPWEIRISGIKRKFSPQEQERCGREGGDVEILRVEARQRGMDYSKSFSHPATRDYELMTEYDNKASVSILRRPAFVGTGSEEAFKLMKHWIGNCESHGSCAEIVAMPFPPRVLYVGSDVSQPYIHISQEGDVGKYVALSYCWGRDQTVCLLKSHLSQQRITFSLESLPKTIRDAIYVTRKLGYAYIWIDALCIVQNDDGEDWRSGRHQMDKVYGWSALTIGAHTGPNVDYGMFSDMIIPGHHNEYKCQIPYDFEDTSTEVGSAFIAEEPLYANWKGAFDYASDAQPIRTRAWTLQERFLSPRFIAFRHGLISWDCRSMEIYSHGPVNAVSSLDSPGHIPLFSVKNLERKHQQSITTSGVSATTTRQNTHIEMMDYWMRAVEYYSSRNLTRSSDKFAAISGLANIIYDNFQDNYLAGLWKSDLKRQLVWAVLHVGPVSRPPQYRAPSWSWASIDGDLFWPLNSNRDEQIVGNITYPFDVVAAQTELCHPTNKFGDVKNGWIWLRGQMKQVVRDRSKPWDFQLPYMTPEDKYCEPRGRMNGEMERLDDYIDDQDYDISTSSSSVDQSPSESKEIIDSKPHNENPNSRIWPDVVWCMIVARRDNKIATIMVLKPVENVENTFTRIGLLYEHDSLCRWMSDAEVSTVKII